MKNKQDYDERIEIIKEAVDHAQNKKSPAELNFEFELTKINNEILGWFE